MDQGGAVTWTVAVAQVAVVGSVVLSQLSTAVIPWLTIGLGLLVVGYSWAMMIYAFAEQYLRLSLLEEDRPHLQLDVDEEERFDDYLTFAVLVSTMAATSSAKISTRKAWTTVRANVLLAFIFNTVIVAMVVSLLFCGITA